MKISVIIPAYNEEEVISKAIKSIINSSYKNYEVIVVDNGSTDDTAKIIKEFKNKKIKLFNYVKKRGPAAARNYGVKKASGEVIFFLDADDWLRSDTLMSIKESFDKKPDINAVISYRKPVFANDWRVIWAYEFTTSKEKGYDVVTKDYVNCPYIFRREFFNKIGGFDDSTYYFEDEQMIDKLISKQVKVLINGQIVFFTDMGSSFNDYYRRAKNIGRGVVISKEYFKLFKILGLSAFFIGSLVKPLIFLSFYTFFGLLWWYKSKKFIVGLTAPLLFVVKKLIGSFFIIKELIKKVF